MCGNSQVGCKLFRCDNVEWFWGFSIIFSLVLAPVSWAQDRVQIKLGSFSRSLSCLKDEKAQGYVCKGEDGQPVLVSSSGVTGVGGFNYTAISFNEKVPGVLRTHVVEEIRENEKVIVSATSGYPGIGSYGGWGGTSPSPPEGKVPSQAGKISGTGGVPGYGEFSYTPPPPENTDNSLLSVYNDYRIASLFGAKPSDKLPAPKAGEGALGNGIGTSSAWSIPVRQRGGESFERTFEIFRKNYEEMRSQITSVLERSDFQLELSDGQKVACVKGKNRQLSDEEKERFSAFGAMVACQIMKCGPAKWEGKERNLVLLIPYSSGMEGLTSPMALVASDSEGIVDTLKVRALRHSEPRYPLLALNPEYEKFSEDLAKKNAQSGFGSFTLAPPSKDDLSFLTHPMTKASIEQFKNTCAPNDSIVRFFDKHYLGLRNAVAQKELVQVIGESGQILNSRWELARVANRSCGNGTTIVDKSVLKPDSIQSFSENTKPRTITIEKAQGLFDQAKQMKDLAWNYKSDGCYARAHLMARRFESQGIEVGKVWISGTLQVPEENLAWNFHTAPVVYVEDQKGNVERYVIDPSLAKTAVTVSQWSSLMKKGVIGPDTYTSFPFPANAASFERTAIAFSSSKPYLPYDPLDKTEEQKMAEAMSIMKSYKEAQP